MYIYMYIILLYIYIYRERERERAREREREGKGNPLQYSCLKNPMDREASQAIVHRVTKSRQESDTTEVI